MNSGKKDFLIGLIYFFGIVILVLSFFTAPDGVALFNKFIGIFGLDDGIQLGVTTLYIWGLFPIIGVIFCFKKARKHWWNFNERFENINIFLRSIHVIVVVVLYFAVMGVHPSLIDRIYFSSVSRQNGLRAITIYAPDSQLNVENDGYQSTFSFSRDILICNHSDDFQTFNIKIVYEGFEQQETFARDSDGDIKTFQLAPRSLMSFQGFTTSHDIYIRGNYTGNFSLILINAYEQHSPTFLIRRPLF
jgi:hypothetical protein